MLRMILAVDDSELLHRMYDLVLMRYSRQGTRILHAMNGHDALGKLAQHPEVDLVLLDINMPVMSGLEFLKHRRATNSYENIPVIVISTEGKDHDTTLALQAGAVAYVTKPFQPNELHSIIDGVLSARRSMAANRP